MASTKLKQNEAQSTHAESVCKGVNLCSEVITQTQQQRPESPAVTLTWHVCKFCTRDINLTRGTSSIKKKKKKKKSWCSLVISFKKHFEDVPLIRFMYLVFTRMPGESYVDDSGLCCCACVMIWPHCGVYHTLYVMMTTLWGLSYTLCDDDHNVGFIILFMWCMWWWPHCGVYHTLYVMMTTMWGLSYTLCDDDHIVGFIIHFMWWWPHYRVYVMTMLWGLSYTLCDDDHIMGFMWWWPHCGV